MVNLAILFIVLILAAYVTNYLLVRSFLGFRWRIFVAPGVILHELSHALACAVTFTKVVKVSFFDKDGGSVTHKKSPIPIFGPILISIAPLLVGIIIFYYLGQFIHLENSLYPSAILNNFKNFYRAIDLSSWQNIIIVYLLLSIAVTMTPSWQDLINMMIPLVILAIILFLLLQFTALNLNNFEPILLNLVPILNLAVLILFGCFIISLIFYFLTKIIFRR